MDPNQYSTRQSPPLHICRERANLLGLGGIEIAGCGVSRASKAYIELGRCITDTVQITVERLDDVLQSGDPLLVTLSCSNSQFPLRVDRSKS